MIILMIGAFMFWLLFGNIAGLKHDKICNKHRKGKADLRFCLLGILAFSSAVRKKFNICDK